MHVQKNRAWAEPGKFLSGALLELLIWGSEAL